MGGKALKTSAERLNALSKINAAAKYLEIGVAKGSTFTQVDVAYKVGVDPRFRFNTTRVANARTVFHEATSDVFFSSCASQYGSFDLIYLDGLHTFEQTWKDFCASLVYAHQDTLWLLDDTCPSGWLAANTNRQLTDQVRGRLHLKDRNWMGDVYKVVFAIHDLLPELSYATFRGHGQTVVWYQYRDRVTPTWNSIERISRLGYRHFLRFRRSHLAFRDDQEIMNSIAARKQVDQPVAEITH